MARLSMMVEMMSKKDRSLLIILAMLTQPALNRMRKTRRLRTSGVGVTLILYIEVVVWRLIIGILVLEVRYSGRIISVHGISRQFTVLP